MAAADTAVSPAVRNAAGKRLSAVLRTRPRFALGYGIVLAIILLAILAPLIAPSDPQQANPAAYLQPPGWPHLMGTDATGLDIFSRVIYAPRIDLTIALAGTVVSAIVGSILGAAAGYYETKRGVGTLVSGFIMRSSDVLQAFPVFVFAIAVVAVLGQSLYSIVLAVCAALAACAQQPPRAVPEETPVPGAAPPRAVVGKPETRRPVLPEVELSEELLFKMMLAEVALQRGQPHIAVQTYLELARETRDPRVAQRATEVAWNARFSSAALEAAGIWLQVDPGSAQARQVIAALLVNQARIADAQPHLEKWLATGRDSVGQSFLQLSTLLARHKDKPEVLKLMQALAQPYPDGHHERIACPVIILTGSEDGSHQSAFALKERIPHCELKVLPGAGHACQMTSEADKD